MIKHIVLFRFKETANFDKKEALIEVKNALDALPMKIPQIRKFETGVDILHKERSYDIAIVSEFDNLEDLEHYRIHPEHIKVVELIAKYKDSAVAVDYEF